MYSMPSPLAFEINLFAGSVCSEAVRCGVLAGRAGHPAAANRSSLSATPCPSVSQPQSARQAEMHAPKKKWPRVEDMHGDSGCSMSVLSTGLFGSPAVCGRFLDDDAIEGTAVSLSEGR